MGNIISNERAGADSYLQMSNGATSVLLDILCLAASDIASSQWEIETAIWLAEHDQSIIGLGVVGFDISEIGWSRENFPAQQQFTVSTIDLAMKRHRWKLLNYEPRLDVTLENLEIFKTLVELYRSEHIKSEDVREWRVEPSPPYLKCPIHKIYLHYLMEDPKKNCRLCHA